jgi:hypothetical protein
VDDLIISALDSSGRIAKAKKLILSRFDGREEGFPQLFIGLQIQRFENGDLAVHQTRYLLKILEQFGELQGHSAKTPLEISKMAALLEASKESNIDQEFMKTVPYRSFCGSLLWLAKGSRPDILQAVSFLARFQTGFGPEHWRQAKHLFAYLRGTLGFGLIYSAQGEGPFGVEEVVGFADANWGDLDLERRSTTGYAFGLANAAIAYISRRQKTIATSTTEAEIYAISDAAKEAKFLKSLVLEMFKSDETITLYADSQSARDVGYQAEYNRGRTKHIDIKDLFIKQAIKFGIVKLLPVGTAENVADTLTKPLPYPIFVKHRDGLGVRKILEVEVE